MDRIWIELGKPTGKDLKEVADRRAMMATKVLRKLGDEFSGFFWDDKLKCYCVTLDKGGTYVTCEDNGHWFNLEYFFFLAEGKSS